MPSATKRIEVFRPGVFTPMVGAPIDFTAADLAALAEGYDHVNAPAPVVVGHPKTDAPAYGWATRFVYDEGAQKLFAEIGDLAPAFEEAVKAKTYRKISLSLFKPDAPNNPAPGKWYPKHIGFLGGAAPAVPGLAPVELAADDEHSATIECGDAAFFDVAMLFRGLRDWLIEKHGRDEAEKVLPDYAINWIERAARDDDDRGLSPAYSEPTMSKEQEAAFAAREEDLSKREAVLKAQEEAIAKQARAQRHDAHVAFAEKLADDGRLLPAFVNKVAGALDALAEVETEASFAEGDKTVTAAPLDLVKEILAGAPKIVSFGEHDKGRDPGGATGSANFAAPEGMQVDAEGAALHEKALAWQQQHQGVSYLDAVKAVGGK